jgi:hypothetical protein
MVTRLSLRSSKLKKLRRLSDRPKLTSFGRWVALLLILLISCLLELAGLGWLSALLLH